MARPGDWSALGLHGDPTPGDPDVLQSIYHQMDDLGSLAREITSGLNRVLDQSSDGFVGKTAEEVRKKIDGHLKKFIDSVGDSFGVAAPATMDYLNAIKDAQTKADQALAGAQGLSKDDPALSGWKSQVHDAQEAYRSAASTYFDKLSEASHMIQQPISGWKLFLEALGILGIILAVLGAIFGGWVGLLAMAVNLALLIKTAVDFAEGKASVLDLVLAVIGVLFPSTKGLNLGSMSKGIFNALKNLPKTVMTGLSNAGRGLTHIFTNPGSLVTAVSSMKSLPGLVINGLLTIGRVTLNAGKLAWGGLKAIGGAIRNDFHLATIGVQGTLPKIGVYAISFGSRFVVSATLPLDFFELGIGARAAIKMGLGTRLTTPWAHLSQSAVNGGLHIGSAAGGHFGVHTGAQSGFHDITGSTSLSGAHGLNLTTDVGGLHNLTGAGAVHLGGNLTPTSLAHTMSNVSPGAGAVEHLTAFDHATGFDRTASGLLTPSSMHMGGFDAGTSHLGSVNTGTVNAGGTHIGAISSHTVRTDLSGSATGLRSTMDDSFSGFHSATSHVENFQALGISELKSIVDGDVSVGRITPDSVSLHVGAQSGTPTALHMNFRTMSLTNDAGQQVVVGPEVHSALGTTGDTHVAAHAAGAPPVNGSHPTAGSGEFKAATGGGTPFDGSTGALGDHGLKVNGTTAAGHGTTLDAGGARLGAHGTTVDASGVKLAESGVKPGDARVQTGPGATRLPDNDAGTGTDAGRFTEDTKGVRGSHEFGESAEAPGVTAQGDHLGVSAGDRLDLGGASKGTGDTSGAAHGVRGTEFTEAAESGLLAAAPTHIAIRPEPHPQARPAGASGGHGGGTPPRPPRSRFEAITGGVGGRIGAQRVASWNKYEEAIGTASHAEKTLEGLGGGLDRASSTVDQAAAKLDAQQALIGIDGARQELARLGMDTDGIRARLDQLGPTPKGRPGSHPGPPPGHTETPHEGPHEGPHDGTVHEAPHEEVSTHDAATLDKLRTLDAPTGTPGRSGIEAAPSAPTTAPVSGLGRQTGHYVERLDSLAKDAGMSRADRDLYRQAIDDAVRADDFRGVAQHYGAFRDHTELSVLKQRFGAFEAHVDQGFDRFEQLGVDRAEWQAKVDAVHDARETHDLDLQNGALRDYTAFVERHVPSEVLTGKDLPRPFDPSLRQVLGDLASAGGPGEYARLREELSGLLEQNAFRERLDALRGDIGDQEAALNAQLLSAGTPEESGAALKALQDFRADQDLASRLDALKSDVHTGSAAGAKTFEERLEALRGPVTDPHELELQQKVDAAADGHAADQALRDLHDYREERDLQDLQARVDALRGDPAADAHAEGALGDGGHGVDGTPHAGTGPSDEELAERFAALHHGDSDPHFDALRQQAHSAGSFEEGAAALDKLHAYRADQEALRQQRVGELRLQIDRLTGERTEHLLHGRLDQAGRLKGELDGLNNELDRTMSAGEKHAELITELAKGVDRPEAAGHLDRIVDKAVETAGGGAERSAEEIEKLLGGLPDVNRPLAPHVHEDVTPDGGTGHGGDSPGDVHGSDLHGGDPHAGDLRGGDPHGGDVHGGAPHAPDEHLTGGRLDGDAEGAAKGAGHDDRPARVDEPGSEELTLTASKDHHPEAKTSSDTTLPPDSVPSALDMDAVRAARGEAHDAHVTGTRPAPGGKPDAESVPAGTGTVRQTSPQADLYHSANLAARKLDPGAAHLDEARVAELHQQLLDEAGGSLGSMGTHELAEKIAMRSLDITPPRMRGGMLDASGESVEHLNAAGAHASGSTPERMFSAADFTHDLRARLNDSSLLDVVHDGVDLRGLTELERAEHVFQNPHLDPELAAALGRPDLGRDLAKEFGKITGKDATDLRLKLGALMGRPEFAKGFRDTGIRAKELAGALGPDLAKKAGGLAKLEKGLDNALQKLEKPPVKTRVIKQPGYATGDQFGIAAALMGDKDMHVVVVTGMPDKVATDKGASIAKFYKDSGIDESRVHLATVQGVESVDAAADREIRDLLPGVKVDKVPVGTGTTWVADHFSVGVRRQVRANWKLDDAGFSAAQKSHLGEWLGDKGIVPSPDRDTIVLWSRFSGKKGDVHVEHDTSFTGIEQILEKLKLDREATGGPGPLVIIAGDAFANEAKAAGKYPAMAEKFTREGLEVHNLTHFWEAKGDGAKDALKAWGGDSRIGQMKLYEYLKQNSRDVRHLGFRSGNLEGLALSGHTVRYMEEPGSIGGERMAKWHAAENSPLSAAGSGKFGKGQALATGYERILVQQPPTRSGKYIAERLTEIRNQQKNLELTKDAAKEQENALMHPDWAFGAAGTSAMKPVETAKFAKGFATGDLDTITRYLTGGHAPVTVRPGGSGPHPGGSGPHPGGSGSHMDGAGSRPGGSGSRPGGAGPHTDGTGPHMDGSGSHTGGSGSSTDVAGGHTDTLGGHTDAPGGHTDTLGGHTETPGGHTDVGSPHQGRSVTPRAPQPGMKVSPRAPQPGTAAHTGAAETHLLADGDLSDGLRGWLNRPELLDATHDGVRLGDLTDLQRAELVLEHPDLDLHLAGALGRPELGRDLADVLLPRNATAEAKADLAAKISAAAARPEFRDLTDRPALGKDLAAAVGKPQMGTKLVKALTERGPGKRVLWQPGYATGDQFGIAAALMGDKDLHVVVVTGMPDRVATDKGASIAKFYKDSGIDESRVHLVSVNEGQKTDAAATAVAERILDLPTSAAKKKMLPVGAGTTWVADNFNVGVRQLVRSHWKLDDAGFSAAQKSHLGEWLGDKGVVPSPERDTVVLWSRFSGKKGDVHVEHDTSYTGIEQILDKLKLEKERTGGPGPLVIIAGDAFADMAKAGKYPAMAEKFTREGLEVHNLTHFWEAKGDAAKDALKAWGGDSRIGQMKLYEHLRQNSASVRHLGFRSGNLEALALSGHTVRYMEEPGSHGGERMAKWHAAQNSPLSATGSGKFEKGGSLATGYERILVKEPPTRSGKYITSEMAQIKDLKEKGELSPKDAKVRNDALLHPDWAFGAGKGAVKPVETAKFAKGFAAEDLDTITGYLTGPMPGLRHPHTPAVHDAHGSGTHTATLPHDASVTAVTPRAPVQDSAAASHTGTLAGPHPGVHDLPAAAHEFKQEPRTFLERSAVLMRMSDGMKARTPGLGIDHGRFLTWMDGKDRHWFTLTPHAESTQAGRKVYLLTPAVEKYAHEFAGDPELREILGDRELPPLRGEGDYLAAHYVPYFQGKPSVPETQVGHADIPLERGDGFSPDFVFTAAMNGCAFTVTRGEAEGTFRAWHFQSPTTNRAESERFRLDRRPVDWFGDGEYQSPLDQSVTPETTNIMWRGDHGWQFLSQENHTTREDVNDVWTQQVSSRAVHFDGGHRLDYVLKFYTRTTEDRLTKLSWFHRDYASRLDASQSSLSLKGAWALHTLQAQRDVAALGKVTTLDGLHRTLAGLTKDHETTAALMKGYFDKQEAAFKEERDALQKQASSWWPGAKSATRALDDLERLQGQVRFWIKDLTDDKWLPGLQREADALTQHADEPLGVSAAAPHGHALEGAAGPAGGHTLSHTAVHAPPGASAHFPASAHWQDARAQAPHVTRTHRWVDPVSRPLGGVGHDVPRYVVESSFDARRFTVDGQRYTDLTVKVHLSGTGTVSPGRLDEVWQRTQSGVDRLFNAGHTMPDGSTLHVTLERAASAKGAHLSAKVGPHGTPSTQDTWAVDASDQVLAHELGHQLGLRDEYRDEVSPHRPEITGSLMGDFHRAPEGGLPGGGMRGRYLQLIHAVIGDLDDAPAVLGAHTPHTAPADHAPGAVAPHAPLNGPADAGEIREVPRTPEPEHAPPLPASALLGATPPPAAVVVTDPRLPGRFAQGQIGGADRVLPSAGTERELTDGLFAGLGTRLGQDHLTTLRARWEPEFRTAVLPSLSAMTRGESRTLHMDVGGWSGDVKVTARVDHAGAPEQVDSLEFEDGTETFNRTGFLKERMLGGGGGILVKGKAAEHTDLTGSVNATYTSTTADRVATSSRQFSRGKTPEPAMRTDTRIRLDFDFSQVRDLLHRRFDLAQGSGERVTTLSVPVHAPVATSAAEAADHVLGDTDTVYLPPRRIEQTRALGGTDIVRDVFPVDADGARTPVALSDALLGSAADPASLTAYGTRTFGADWPAVRELILGRAGSLDVLHFRLKPMTGGHALEVDLGPRGTLLITAEVSSMTHLRNTKQTEFNTGSDVTRIFSVTESRNRAVRATFTSQSSDLHAGPGTLSGEVSAQHDTEGVTIRQVSVRSGRAVKMKVPGVVFDGVAKLHFAYRPAGAVEARATGATSGRLGFQALVEAADSRIADGAVRAFHAPDGTTGPRRMAGPQLAEGDLAWRPNDDVWQGLPEHSVVLDVLLGEERAAGQGAAPAPALDSLVDDLGRRYFGDHWTEVRASAKDMVTPEQLAVWLPEATRGATAHSVPLPEPLHTDARLSASGRLLDLEYLRPLNEAELNLLNEITEDAGTRLNSAVTGGGMLQGGVQGDIAENLSAGMHPLGGGMSHRSATGTSASGAGNNVASAKFGRPMALYIARVHVDAGLGRPGDAAARNGASDVRFVVAVPQSHAVQYEVGAAQAGRQVFTAPATPAPATRAAVPPVPSTSAASGTLPDPGILPPARVTRTGQIGAGDAIVKGGDSAALVKALRARLGDAFQDKWGQVEADLNLFFDGSVVVPKTPGLTSGATWGTTVSANGVTADITITSAHATITGFDRVERKFEFEQGTESSAAVGSTKNSTSRRTLWQRLGFRPPHTSITVARSGAFDRFVGRVLDNRSGLIAKGKTVEPAAVFKGDLAYHLDITLSGRLPGTRTTDDLTVTTHGEFAFPVRELPVDPATKQAPKPAEDYRPPRRVEDSRVLGASDIVLAVRPSKEAVAGGATDVRDAFLDQLEDAGVKAFGSHRAWASARAKLRDAMPADEFHRRLKPMMGRQPWELKVDGRRMLVTASVENMEHAGNTDATEFYSAAVGTRTTTETQPPLLGDHAESTATGVSVVGTSNPVGGLPVEVFAGGGVTHTAAREDVTQSTSAARVGSGTKYKAPGTVFDGTTRLHVEFRQSWRPWGRTVDQRVPRAALAEQRAITDLQARIARLGPGSQWGKVLQGQVDTLLADQTERIRAGVLGKAPAAPGQAPAPMTRGGFGVRRRTFAHADLGFQAVLESADAVKAVADDTAATTSVAAKDAKSAGDVTTATTVKAGESSTAATKAGPSGTSVKAGGSSTAVKAAEAPPATVPVPPRAVFTSGLSADHLVRDLPDVGSLRSLIDAEGRKAYGGVWTSATRNGRLRSELVMDAFPKDRIMENLPDMTRGGELTSDEFRVNGRKAWVSATAVVHQLTHDRPETRAETALVNENTKQFGRRALRSRQLFLNAQLGAQASDLVNKIGAAGTFSIGGRARAGGEQATGGRTFANAKIPTRREHFDGFVEITFTFHLGDEGTAVGGIVPFSVAVPAAEITEHVPAVPGGHFTSNGYESRAAVPDGPLAPPTPERPAPAPAPVLPKLEPLRFGAVPPPREPQLPKPEPLRRGSAPAPATPPVPPALEPLRSTTDVLPPAPEPLTPMADVLPPAPEVPPVAPELPPHAPEVQPQAGGHRFGQPLDTIEEEPEPLTPMADVLPPAPEVPPVAPELPPHAPEVQPQAGGHRFGQPLDTIEEEPETDSAPGTPPRDFDAIRTAYPEPVRGHHRWTMWGVDGATPHTSAYAVEFPDLGLRGVYAPPAEHAASTTGTAGTGGLGSWIWHSGTGTEPVAVTPFRLLPPEPGAHAPAGTAPGTASAPPALQQRVEDALSGAGWTGGLRWRTDADDLYVFADASGPEPERVFAEGLLPSGTDAVPVVAHAADADAPGSLWVTATRDIGWLRNQAAANPAHQGDLLDRYGWRYDIAAPGGVDVNSTLNLATPHPERSEVLFPGGIDGRLVLGAQRLRNGRAFGRYVTNDGSSQAPGTGTDTKGTAG